MGVEVISLGERRRPDFRALSRLLNILRQRQIDILQTHILYAGITGRILGRIAGVPVIVSTEQDVRLGAQAGHPVKRWLNDLTLPLANANVYITQAVANSFKKSVGRSIFEKGLVERRIPNGTNLETNGCISTDKRLEARIKLQLEQEHFVIGTVGRLETQKGHQYLIRAFGEVSCLLPNARLVIVGWGTLEHQLETQAEQLGVRERVLMLGQRTDVLKLLPGFDVFAFPSIFEAQGVAILEAMTEGVPVIASNVGGIPEMVLHERTGLLVGPRNVAALRDAILRIQSEPEFAERLSRSARLHVANEYSIQCSVKQYDLLYKELASAAPTQLS
jgi:glycosyltransferase involved in cell wall biosynthesis